MEFQLYKCKNWQFHSKWFIAAFSQIQCIHVRKLTVLYFTNVCVHLYKIYESHREKTSKLAVKDVRKHLLKHSLELRAQVSSTIGQLYVSCGFLLFKGKSPGM